MKYSVLMSVYVKENPKYLRESIDSVMAQTMLPDEFVIVCDGPLTTQLDEVLAEYEKKYPKVIRLLRLPENKGLGLALNEGIRICRNNIVARMDSDDICLPDRMERQLRVMEKEGAHIVSGTIIEFGNSVSEELGRRVLPEKHKEICRFSRKRNPFNHATAVYCKDKVMEAGGYRDFKLFEDYYLWLRMLKKGAIGYNIQEPVLYVRTGEGMYERRGGLAYARQILRFRWYMLCNGHCNLMDFLIASVGHVLIALIPTGLRQKFYEKALRK